MNDFSVHSTCIQTSIPGMTCSLHPAATVHPPQDEAAANTSTSTSATSGSSSANSNSAWQTSEIDPGIPYPHVSDKFGDYNFDMSKDEEVEEPPESHLSEAPKPNNGMFFPNPRLLAPKIMERNGFVQTGNVSVILPPVKQGTNAQFSVQDIYGPAASCRFLI